MEKNENVPLLSAANTQITSNLTQNSSIYIGFLPDAGAINLQIMDSYSGLGDQDMLRRSHFFGGRFENLYLDHERIPALGQVLAQATTFAAALLGLPEQALKRGFWFNDMGPGQSTTKHDHDEYDELLSAVYYVHVPENSGSLIIHDRYSQTEVTPESGMFVFFAPAVLHSVSSNQSEHRRLSIGMNFGPA
ncbi:MAG: 2OG-Fe(II) oxygenase [Gallionella sp.]|nr:2OG-Fe(II) oxygenase [Gallionella sp.]MDP1942107.1 2OG-Fe(II) oxygenase [Gallionella sp.]